MNSERDFITAAEKNSGVPANVEHGASVVAARAALWAEACSANEAKGPSDLSTSASLESIAFLHLPSLFSRENATSHQQEDDPRKQLKLLQHEARDAFAVSRKLHNSTTQKALLENLRQADSVARTWKGRSQQFGLSEPAASTVFQTAADAYKDVTRLGISKEEETRACWLDRKTIVSAGPGELAREIKELAAAGINTIYFECDNGGYATYDSKILPRNPDLNKWPGWDPLKEAIEAGHANGVKVEAWTKDFLGCNQALDQKLKAAHPGEDIPQNGPILSRHDSNNGDSYGDWTMRQPDGKMQSSNDLFMDPANPEVRKFVQDFLLELAKKYPGLDGIQYDYIRYPFGNSELGINENNWRSFQSEYTAYKDVAKPANAEQMSKQMSVDWNQWKAGQIDSFVRDSSAMLWKENPKLDISAAVYPTDYNEGLHQHWAKWMQNGWIKTLNPMTYVPHDASSNNAELTPADVAKFKSNILSIEKASGGKGRILPGIEVARVNAEGVMKEADVVRDLEMPGESLFAASVFNQKKFESFELRDCRDDFDRLTQLMHRTWTDGAPSTRMERKQFVHDADQISTTVDALDTNSSRVDIESVLNHTTKLRDGIDQYLRQHPDERSAWTDEFTRTLDRSITQLDAAANPIHLAAWDTP